MKTFFQFDHNADDIYNACGLSTDAVIRTREKILFCLLNSSIKTLRGAIENGSFDNNCLYNKVSHTLEEVLELFEVEAERNLALLMFLKMNDICKPIPSLLAPMLLGAPQFVKDTIMEKLNNSHEEIKKALHQDQTFSKDEILITRKLVLSPLNLYKRIELIMNSNDSFDTYISKYAKAGFEPMYMDVDKILSDVFDFNV